MKQIIALVAVVALMFSFAGCGSKNPQADVVKLVEKHYDAIVEACEASDAEALSDIKGVEKVNVIDGYVIVLCEAKGISVSSQDYGFYYAADNRPITVDCNQDIVCTAEELSREGDGFQCVVDQNTFYTESIKGNLYFYSNAY